MSTMDARPENDDAAKMSIGESKTCTAPSTLSSATAAAAVAIDQTEETRARDDASRDQKETTTDATNTAETSPSSTNVAQSTSVELSPPIAIKRRVTLQRHQQAPSARTTVPNQMHARGGTMAVPESSDLHYFDPTPISQQPGGVWYPPNPPVGYGLMNYSPMMYASPNQDPENGVPPVDMLSPESLAGMYNIASPSPMLLQPQDVSGGMVNANLIKTFPLYRPDVAQQQQQPQFSYSRSRSGRGGRAVPNFSQRRGKRREADAECFSDVQRRENQWYQADDDGGDCRDADCGSTLPETEGDYSGDSSASLRDAISVLASISRSLESLVDAMREIRDGMRMMFGVEEFGRQPVAVPESQMTRVTERLEAMRRAVPTSEAGRVDAVAEPRTVPTTPPSSPATCLAAAAVPSESTEKKITQQQQLTLDDNASAAIAEPKSEVDKKPTSSQKEEKRPTSDEPKVDASIFDAHPLSSSKSWADMMDEDAKTDSANKVITETKQTDDRRSAPRSDARDSSSRRPGPQTDARQPQTSQRRLCDGRPTATPGRGVPQQPDSQVRGRPLSPNVLGSHGRGRGIAMQQPPSSAASTKPKIPTPNNRDPSVAQALPWTQPFVYFDPTTNESDMATLKDVVRTMLAERTADFDAVLAALQRSSRGARTEVEDANFVRGLRLVYLWMIGVKIIKVDAGTSSTSPPRRTFSLCVNSVDDIVVGDGSSSSSRSSSPMSSNPVASSAISSDGRHGSASNSRGKTQ